MVRHCCAVMGTDPAPLVNCEAEVVRQMDFLGTIEAGTVLPLEPCWSELVAFYQHTGETCSYDVAFFPQCAPFQGTVAAMGPCHDGEECIRGEDPVGCLGITSTEPGSCVTLTRGALGDACMDTATETYFGVTSVVPNASVEPPVSVVCHISDGLYCSLARVCEPLIAPGQPCQVSEGCQPGYTCPPGSGIPVVGGAPNDRVCVPENQVGDPCTDRCSGNLVCQNNTCSPIPVGYDEQCEGDFD
jgi:hypothetical protein